MRGWYEIRCESDSRFNKRGEDFICPYRGALNFDQYEWVKKICKKIGTVEPPSDIKFFVFWEDEDAAK